MKLSKTLKLTNVLNYETILLTLNFGAIITYYQKTIRELADSNFNLLKENPNHPSLHLNKIGHFW